MSRLLFPLAALRSAFLSTALSVLLVLITPAARFAAQEPDPAAHATTWLDQGAAAGVPAPPSSLTVAYTGRLFGYYRIEPMEPIEGGTTTDPAPKLRFVRSFLHPNEAIKIPPKDADSPTLLLGMGDNFAPEFGAAIQQEFKGAAGEWAPCAFPQKVVPTDPTNKDLKQRKYFAPESLYKSEDRLPAMADCDNVTRFLMTAGYRAVVPGREDFIYSATWLRRIAALLKGASKQPSKDDNPFKYLKDPSDRHSGLVDAEKWKTEHTKIASADHKLHMLAANLRIKVTDSSCPLFFAENMATKVPCAKGGNAVTEQMDWLRRIDQSLRKEIAQSIERQATTQREFNTQLLENQQAIFKTVVEADSEPLNEELRRLPEQEKHDPANQKKQDRLDFFKELGKIGSCAVDSAKSEPANGQPKRTPCSELGDLPKPPSGDLDLGIYCTAREIRRFVKPKEEPKADSTEVRCQKAIPGPEARFDGEAEPYHPDNATLPNVLLPEKYRLKIRDLLLGTIYREQEDVGFTIADLPNPNSTKRALIIGVVGTETMQEISPDYFKVFPDEQDYPTAEYMLKTPKKDLTDFKCPSEQDQKSDPRNPVQPNQKSDPKDIVCKTKKEHWTDRHKEEKSESYTPKANPFDLLVGDPRFAATTLLRAAWAERQALAKQRPNDKPLFDFVIVMAQMPHTEADELGAHIRGEIADLYKCADGTPRPDLPVIDLILSEAQAGHQSPNITTAVNIGDDTLVLTPADSSTPMPETYTHPASWVTLTLTYSTSDQTSPPDLTAVNNIPKPDGKPVKLSDGQKEPYSAAFLLHTELQLAGPFAPNSEYESLWDQCPKFSACQNSVLIQYLLRELQISAKSDVVLLKRRDFYFDWLGKDYADYRVCKKWAQEHSYAPDSFQVSYCQLHTALDRVLWKGDYSERVMVDGTTLAALMKTAKSQTEQEQTLLARDLHQEWLMTYGIVTTPPKDLTAAASGPEAFSVPGLDGCSPPLTSLIGKDPTASNSAYCIDGQSIAPDRSYWLATSNQLAEDTTVYSDLGNLIKKNESYSQDMKQLFLTTEIANQILPFENPPPAPKPTPDTDSMAKVELHHQIRPLVQLDFTKLVAGYALTAPSLSASEIDSNLAGVTNTTATNPESQELDLEAATRLIYAPLLPTTKVLKWLTFGAQSDAEFDRKFTQNINGSPDTVTYSTNTFSTGGFAQLTLPAFWKLKAARNALDRSTRNLSRWYVVAAPYQFQRQIATTYLAFPYYTISPGSTKYSFSSTQFDNVKLPLPMGFSQRIGVRFESSGIPKWTPDPGSYAEVGPEYFVQNNVLAAIQLRDILTSPTDPTSYTICPASAVGVLYKGPNGTIGNPFINCAKNAYLAASPQIPLTAKSDIVPVPKTLHTGGVYWTSHIQKAIDAKKANSVSFDTSGDTYLWNDVTLPTQTRYALTTKLAFNLKIIGNLSFSPTWSGFFYENQGDQGVASSRTSLITHTLSVTAKWYFARDAAVPFPKQLWFAGPTSVDQASSAKMK